METGRTVFAGPRAIQEFLDPDQQPPLPLVEIPRNLNPYWQDNVRIYAKLMYLLPLLTIKSLPALQMLMDAHASGRLEGVHTLVEASSGNTVFSLGVVARLFGIHNIQAVVPRDIAPGKLEMLRLSGVDPVFHSESPTAPSGIARAREMGRSPGFFNAGQYENESNPASHEKWTARQVWEQLQGSLTVYCCGLGTTGTLIGAKRFFTKHKASVSVVGVVCAPENAVPGVRTARRLQEIGFDWKSMLDHQIEAGTKESFKRSLQLCRAGLMAGPSSGFALAGLLKFLHSQHERGQLDALRNAKGEVVASFICTDTPLPYLDKYSTHLDPSDFEDEG
jgi:cysteine synthase